MTYTKKKIKEGKPDPNDRKKFVIESGGENEEDIVILFKSDADADRAKKIDKLSLEGLPASGAGLRNIVWLNNFWLKKGNGQYLNDMPYYVQLSKKSGTLVYFDGTDVRKYEGAVEELPNNMIQIELSVGDPASGYGTG